MGKKILIDLSFIRTKPYSGVAKYAYRILDYIIKFERTNQYALLLDVISAEGIKYKYPQFETKTIGNNLIAKLPLVRTFWMQFAFKKIVDSSDYDTVFCPWANQITCLKSKKRIISVIHDLQILIDCKGFAKYRDRCIFDSVIKNSYKIVTISEFSKNQIHSIYPQAHVINLSNSVAMDTINLPERLIPNPYLLFVGRICKMKNLISLVRAFARLSNLYNDLRLIIVGHKNGYWKNEILPILIEKGIEERVSVLEGVSEKQLSALYRDAVLFVFPSLREGFGSPPVEASYMETPVVSSLADSLEEVSLGLWYTYKNPLDDNELSNVINNVLQQPPSKEKLGLIKDQMLLHYSPEVVCKGICDYLENL